MLAGQGEDVRAACVPESLPKLGIQVVPHAYDKRLKEGTRPSARLLKGRQERLPRVKAEEFKSRRGLREPYVAGLDKDRLSVFRPRLEGQAKLGRRYAPRIRAYCGAAGQGLAAARIYLQRASGRGPSAVLSVHGA